LRLRLTIILLLVALLIAGGMWMRGGEEDLFDPDAMPAPRQLDPDLVLAYREHGTLRVRTARDVLPGGLAVAMAPLVVEWASSDIRPGGRLLVRNLNHGGNPLAGVTELRSVWIRPDLVREAQLVLVPLGRHRSLAHVQMRFVFEEGGVEPAVADPATVGEPDAIGDIILSWEAWRHPGVGYGVVKGLDDASFAIGLRGFSGPQRFLEESLNHKPWNAYEFTLPGDRAGLAELLRVTLAMGDGAARHVIAEQVGQQAGRWLEGAPAAGHQGGDATEEWRLIAEGMAARGLDTGDERLDMSGVDSYQTVVRSCAAMALYCVDVAVARGLEAGLPADGKRPVRSVELDEAPVWMKDLSGAGLARVLVSAPRTMSYVRRHPWVVPGNIPGLMAEAGLVAADDRGPVRHTWSLDTMTPWGHRGTLMVR
jgi:hypothetical protein